jgi:uncharacterized protein YyaL (SSP411 family)
VPNALARENSPYLRQHADNPVAWLPWGEAAFAKARSEDKPIFLSIGYSTCHWCHVMAHESFEDEQVAEVLNRDFVSIKIDREERPDVDRIYMLFVQASTGSGGWPLSVWLTPELKPFFGGTYFPPGSNYGRPGFRDLLQHLAQVWKREREKVESSSDSVTEQLRSLTSNAAAAAAPDKELFAAAFWQLRRIYDSEWGGFGRAPKFPRPSVFNYLLRYYKLENNDEALDMVLHSLRRMAAGGMHDHLGGGFHRYSVDERWFVPHFEKMLYDQAQLAIVYLDAYQITQEQLFADVALDILGYVLRDLADPGGAFYSAEDADSPDPEDPAHSVEGAFYVWRQSQIESVLGATAAKFNKHFGVKLDGNVEIDPHGEFTGKNILFQAETGGSDDLIGARSVLFAERNKRPRPHLDNKILTSWNALFVSALVRAYRVLGSHEHLTAARRATAFLLETMYSGEQSRLLRVYSGGETAIPAFLDDYAFLTQALLDLFEAAGDPNYLDVAVKLATVGLDRFEDKTAGGFFSTEADAANLLFRLKDDYDGAEPSGNSVATDVLLRLHQITGNPEFRQRAERSLNSFAPKTKEQPSSAPQMLVALGRFLSPPEQVIIRCAEADKLSSEVSARFNAVFSPYTLTVLVTDEATRMLASSSPFISSLKRQSKVTVYECRDFVCSLPKIFD